MLTLISLQCPKCGSTFVVSKDNDSAFCSHCGYKVLIENDNIHILHFIDDAELVKAKTDQILTLRQIQLLDQERIDSKRRNRHKTIIALTMMIIGIVTICVGFFLGDKSGSSESSYYVISYVGIILLLGSAFIALSMVDNKSGKS